MRGCKKEPRGKNRLSIRANFITLGSSSSPSHPHPPFTPSRARFPFLPVSSPPSTRDEVSALSPILKRLLPRTANPAPSFYPSHVHCVRFQLPCTPSASHHSNAAILSLPVPISLFLYRSLLIYYTFASSRSFSHFVRSLQVCPSFSRSPSLSSCSFASLTGCFPSVWSSLNLVLSFDRVLCRERLPR